MAKVVYLLIIAIGLLSSFVVSFLNNKKEEKIDKNQYICIYFLFITSFFIFSKLFWMLSEQNISTFLNFLKGESIIDILRFIFSGYSFLGGYVGCISMLPILSKVINIKEEKLLYLFVPALTLMYGILKLGCMTIGCCKGIENIPVQPIESIIAISTFILLNIIKIEKGKMIAIFIILFSGFRFVIDFFRVFSTNYSLYINQIICLGLLLYGIVILKRKKAANI